MLECSRFLEGYSAFRDGELEVWEVEEFESHLRECSSCARYDQVISRGVQLYRRAAEITPSEDFLPRLQHRLYHVDDELRGGRTGSGTSAALTLGISAVIAAMAWLPVLRSKPVVLELPPVVARAPLPPPVEPGLLFQSGPFLVRDVAPRAEWSESLRGSASRDLLFRFSPAGAQYHVQSVAQH